MLLLNYLSIISIRCKYVHMWNVHVTIGLTIVGRIRMNGWTNDDKEVVSHLKSLRVLIGNFPNA